jgi:hypothetical protein
VATDSPSIIPDNIQRWYVEWANGLDSAGNDSGPAAERLRDPKTLSLLFECMQFAINGSRNIDRFKKHIFYDKELGEATFDRFNEAYQERNYKPIHSLPPITPDVMARVGGHETIRLLHSVMGLMDEVGELMTPLLNYIYFGEPLDMTNVFEEYGDMLWYMALGCRFFSTQDFAYFMIGNYVKLNDRYPEGAWTKDRALNRDLERERKGLEGSEGTDG